MSKLLSHSGSSPASCDLPSKLYRDPSLSEPWFIFLASREKFADIHNAGDVGASSRHIAPPRRPQAAPPPRRRPHGKGYSLD